MVKKKFYTLSDLADVSRQGTGKAFHKLLKKLDIKPVQEMKVGARVFRAYDHAAMDTITAWRAALDAPKPAPEPKVQAPTPTPAAEGSADQVGRYLLKRLSEIQAQMTHDAAHVADEFRAVHDTFRQVNQALVLLLDAATKPSQDALLGLVNSKDDDHSKASW